MAYGEALTKLNPCDDALICSLLREALPAGGRVLDLACGRGDRLRALSNAFPDRQLSGLDSDAQNAAAAAAACPTARIVCACADALPFPDAAFDAAICECSFSLFAQPQQCAAELARVLREGGALLLSDLYCKRDKGAAARIADNDTVKSIYGSQVLEELFSAAGFRLVQFMDRSADLTQMLGQMLMDGTLCDCLGMEALRQMKQIGTGYGIWIFQRENGIKMSAL